ncbi:ATP-binding cassette domain-containing protein [Marinicrinis lubricantis]|uniref:ATP-binding cassette domain-containing protein n=1 Tax=Marinicrinis lubricantis TaxID=2086470 RepID=A0ABW1INU4_9BACL
MVGRNGSGKSTLLKLIAGLTRPSRGKINRKPGTSIGYAPEHYAVESTSIEWASYYGDGS